MLHTLERIVEELLDLLGLYLDVFLLVGDKFANLAHIVTRPILNVVIVDLLDNRPFQIEVKRGESGDFTTIGYHPVALLLGDISRWCFRLRLGDEGPMPLFLALLLLDKDFE